jgi:hypothetical protein
MNNLTVYSQKGCIGCKSCEGGGANVGRTTVIWTIAICTAGIGLIYLPFYKKCVYCGHNTWWNKHYGSDNRQAEHSPLAG